MEKQIQKLKNHPFWVFPVIDLHRKTIVKNHAAWQRLGARIRSFSRKHAFNRERKHLPHVTIAKRQSLIP